MTEDLTVGDIGHDPGAMEEFYRAHVEPHTGVDGYENASIPWPTPNGSWATLYGYGASARQLPQIASQVTWVDLETWVNTYDASPTESVPAETLADAPTSYSDDDTTEHTSTAP